MILFSIFIALIYCISLVNSSTLWYSYQFDTGAGNREELVINKIVAESREKSEENIIKWKSLSLQNESYALGLTQSGVTVMKISWDDGQQRLITHARHTLLNATVLDAILFTHWNGDLSQYEIIVGVALEENELSQIYSLNWFKISNGNVLNKFWKWSLNNNIISLSIVQVVDSYNVLICNDRYENASSADFYEFTLLDGTNNFWLKQSIALDGPINNVAVSVYGLNTFLSIPQEQQLAVYIYKDNHFVFYASLTAKKVRYVTAFTIGYQSFIAIDGANASIYKFTQNGLEKQAIEGANPDTINYWLTMPAKTYRDDVILIAEHALDHGTHKSYNIDVILYNGQKFVTHDEMACNYFGDISHGINCLMEEDNTYGIRGSAAIALGDNLTGLLIPKHAAPSEIFTFHIQLKPIDSPIDKQINALNEMKARLESKMQKKRDRTVIAKENKVNFDKEPAKYTEKAPELKTDSALKSDTILASKLGETSKIDLQNIFTRLDNLENRISDLLRAAQSTKFNSQPKHYKNLIINGLVEVLGESNIRSINTDNINRQATNNVLADIVRRDAVRPIKSHKAFLDLNTESITFDAINDISSANIAYRNSDPLEIKGDLLFEGDFSVANNIETATVNNLDLEAEIVQVGKPYKGVLNFEQLHVKDTLNALVANKFPVHKNYLDAINAVEINNITTLDADVFYFPGNLTIDSINGENFEELMSRLCFRNIATHIPGTVSLTGTLTVKQDAFTSYLNELKYPENYVFATSNTFSTISGNKIFKNDVVINELSTSGLVNGVDPHAVVTLNEVERISGKFVFDDLKVTETFQAHSIHGEHVNDFLPNPTLLETNVISSNVNFKELHVNGIITIGNNLNNTNLLNILNDVVYKDRAEISSIKEFENGVKVDDLQILSNTLNNIPLDQFVDTESEQVMVTNSLNGDVTFKNLLLTGNYGNINITKLDQDSVKLDGEQFIQSKLIFEEPVTVHDLQIKSFLNDINVQEYIYTKNEREIDELHIDQAEIKNLIIDGDLIGGLSFNLTDYDARRLSYSRDQLINGNYNINSSKIPNIKTNFINNYSYDDLFNVTKFEAKVIDLLFENKLAVKELHVGDTISIKKVNNVPLDNLMKNFISTKPHRPKLEMSFQDVVNFNELHIEQLNGEDFNDFTANVVYKDETEKLVITGLNCYVNGFDVHNYISAPLLNNIHVDNILRKTGEQQILSPLIIEGEVWLQNDTEILESLNEAPMSYLANTFEMLDDNTYKINSDVMFKKVAYIKELHTNGFVNNENMTGFLTRLIRHDSDANINGNVIFNAPVIIQTNLAVNGTTNGVNLTEFKDKVVAITEDGEISSLITFKQPVTINEELIVTSNLTTTTHVVAGIDLREWLDKAVYIDSGLIPGNLQFEECTIQQNANLKFVNDIDLNSLIYLHTDEEINSDIEIVDLSSLRDINVHNLVNDLKLENEYLNTAINGKLQKVSSRVIFDNNVIVYNDIDILNRVNNHNLAKMVTTNTDQNLTANYEFIETAIFDSDMTIDGLLAGCNISNINQFGVKKYSSQIQTVTQPINFEKNVTFDSNVFGNGNISDLNIRNLADQVEERRLFKYNVESNLANQFYNICHDVNDMIKASKTQIYKFKYFDHHQFIDLDVNIKDVHYFEAEQNFYMLVIEENTCVSKLFIWAKDVFTYVRDIETGRISQIITVNGDNEIFFVTRGNESTCEIEGTNVWKFEMDNIILVYKLENLILLSESRVPNTFYGMQKDVVFEYKMATNNLDITIARKWITPTDNAAFIPHGLKLGLALRNGKSVIKLIREDAVIEEADYNDVNSIAVPNITSEENLFIPGRYDGEMIYLHVGYPRRKLLVAISNHEETSIKCKSDFIKIYENVVKGKVYHKILADNPTSLLSLEFGENGETLLIFLENNKKMIVYEYKGVEGFKHRSTTNMEGTKLVSFKLTVNNYQEPRTFLTLINKNRLSLLQAVMDGDQLNLEDVDCNL